MGYIYLFSWHVIGIFIFLWFVTNIFNFSWSVNRQLAVNCDCIVLFTVNGDCLSENPMNCDPNITRDTWFRLLSVKFCIRRIDQNVPIVMIFSQIFRGACPRKAPPLRFRSYTGLIHHRSPHLWGGGGVTHIWDMGYWGVKNLVYGIWGLQNLGYGIWGNHLGYGI